MCDTNCRQADSSYRRCRNCSEIMCDDCHDNMDNTPEVRQDVLKKHVGSTPEHWCFTKKPFMSIATSSSQEEFKRARCVDWLKVDERLGNNFSSWAYDKECFILTQEDRVKEAIAEENAKNAEEIDTGVDWS